MGSDNIPGCHAIVNRLDSEGIVVEDDQHNTTFSSNSSENKIPRQPPLSPSSNIDNTFEKLSININKNNETLIDLKNQKNTDLYTKINSKDFEIFHCISLLQHNSNLGIQYYICKRIQKFPISELRFFAPQCLQLLITMEVQSMALEEMIKDICQVDPHFSLITFWHLQAMLQDLSKEPESQGFQTCKRLVNELQYHLFNYSNNSKTSTSSSASSTGIITKHDLQKEFKPNIYPSLVLCTSLLAGVTVPQTTSYVSPIVKMEGRRMKAMVFEIVKDIKRSLTENLTKKNTLTNASMSKQRTYDDLSNSGAKNELRRAKSSTISKKVHGKRTFSETGRKSEEIGFEMIDTYADLNFPNLRKPSLKNAVMGLPHSHSSASINSTPEQVLNPKTQRSSPLQQSHTNSMPDLHDRPDASDAKDISYSPSPSFTDLANSSDVSSYASSIRNSSDFRDSLEVNSPTSSSYHGVNPIKRQPVLLTEAQKIKLLKSNYFKNETQFVIALQNISIRLSKVPKEARLSTLKAELSLLNKDLPCEIDIPLLLPKNKKGKLHKICRIAVNESAVLNSAERVPYLLLVEYLADEVDFNPSTSLNRKILQTIEDTEDTVGKEKYKFDLSYKSTARSASIETETNSTFRGEKFGDDLEEGDLADVSVVKLKNSLKRKQTLDVNCLLKEADIESLPIPPLNAQSDHENHIATQLRIASIMLTQLDSPNSPLPQLQASQIKTRIIDSMQNMQERFGRQEEAAGERKLSNDMKVAGLSYLGEDWNTKKERIRKESKFGHYENWDLFSMIAKTGDDLAQEAFACQLIHLMANIWYQDKVKVWVKRMKILVTSINTGLVETITNAVSVHSIKKAFEKDLLDHGQVPTNGVVTLKDHFGRMFGDENSVTYKRAQENFSKSLAAYSVICYILQIKDRHNGNIMLDSEGHIIHIDFGFLLSNSPGSVGFESAPFKLTQEYVDVLGGLDSYYFNKFKTLTKEAFKSLRRNSKCIIDMVELMQTDSSLPCFKAGENTSVLLKQRFQLHLTDDEIDSFIDNFIIAKSLNSAYTRLYDQFQLLTQGIYI
ncbi:hypothetical protein CANINC_004138 [Pichia inconspicua]|uniref:1-phosphatidylinositol 4-kinase n=1 Tax=Pichia inconspicua TaxID=52247 RepID=A0A4T0WY05_9ASCO|nr:hypothetical protein CANINC_004138 [[Candida] inconspicua]